MKPKPLKRRRFTDPGADSQYRANFLWPHDDDSIEEAGYEFANANTEAYREEWWLLLKDRIRMEILQSKKYLPRSKP